MQIKGINQQSIEISQIKQKQQTQQRKFQFSQKQIAKKWSVSQNILYGRFLKNYKSKMLNIRKKTKGKFLKMANFIGSKCQKQCRSHHQKMMMMHKSIQQIIKYIEFLQRSGMQISNIQYLQRFKGQNIEQTQSLEQSIKNSLHQIQQKTGKLNFKSSEKAFFEIFKTLNIIKKQNY